MSDARRMRHPTHAMRLAMLLALTLVPGSLLGQGAGARAFDFRGHRLGDEQWDRGDVGGLACSAIQRLTTDQFCEERELVGNAWVTVIYHFYERNLGERKLGRIVFQYAPADFDEVVLGFARSSAHPGWRPTPSPTRWGSGS